MLLKVCGPRLIRHFCFWYHTAVCWKLHSRYVNGLTHTIDFPSFSCFWCLKALWEENDFMQMILFRNAAVATVRITVTCWRVFVIFQCMIFRNLGMIVKNAELLFSSLKGCGICITFLLWLSLVQECMKLHYLSVRKQYCDKEP